MAFDPADYPANWGELRAAVLERAKNAAGVPQCECMGECGLHCWTPEAAAMFGAGSGVRLTLGDKQPHPRRCVEVNGTPAKWAKGTVVLTTAHLCYDAKCADLDHLKAMCQRCHLRLDVQLHKHNRRRRRERDAGQRRLVSDE